MTNRQLFLQHCGQTSDAPLCFEIASAEGIYLYEGALTVIYMMPMVKNI